VSGLGLYTFVSALSTGLSPSLPAACLLAAAAVAAHLAILRVGGELGSPEIEFLRQLFLMPVLRRG
jgi:hypothetical protein